MESHSDSILVRATIVISSDKAERYASLRETIVQAVEAIRESTGAKIDSSIEVTTRGRTVQAPADPSDQGVDSMNNSASLETLFRVVPEGEDTDMPSSTGKTAFEFPLVDDALEL